MNAFIDLLTEAPLLIIVVGAAFSALGAYVIAPTQQNTVIRRSAPKAGSKTEVAGDSAAYAVAKVGGEAPDGAMRTDGERVDDA